jgi:hypothetical protein
MHIPRKKHVGASTAACLKPMIEGRDYEFGGRVSNDTKLCAVTCKHILTLLLIIKLALCVVRHRLYIPASL